MGLACRKKIMKYIDNLTDKEVLALSDKNIESIIKLYKAEEGIKIVGQPEKPEYLDIPKPTHKVYYVKFGWEKYCCADLIELEKFVNYFNDINNLRKISDKDFNDNYSTRVQFIEGINETINIESTLVYTAEEIIELTDKFQHNAKLIKNYQTLLDEYNENIKEAQFIQDEIWDKINEINEKYAKLERYKSLFIDYLQLAQDNEEIAIGFLHKAYLLTDEEKEYVLKNYKEIQ